VSKIKSGEDQGVLQWEQKFTDYFNENGSGEKDASHDLGHFQRVWSIAKQIADEETIRNNGVEIDHSVLVAAAYFHDIVNKKKSDPEAGTSSFLSAKAAEAILKKLRFPEEKIESVKHAIHAHSFSANVLPQTLEAKIIQDADRMESLGALGIARTFYVSGMINTQPFDREDPLANNRQLDDKRFALDHFFTKLLKLQDSMQTDAGRRIAKERSNFLLDFVMRLTAELKEKEALECGALFVAETFHKAGLQQLKLFQSNDPLARYRSFEPHFYALDELLLRNIEAESEPSNFVQYFVEQISEELQAF
jgi:uncharacterized protein